MSDFEKELLADFESETEDEKKLDESLKGEYGNAIEVDEEQSEPDAEVHQSFEARLSNLLKASSGDIPYESILKRVDVNNVEDCYRLSKVLPIISDLRMHIQHFVSDEDSDYYELLSSVSQDDISAEYRFILSINELSLLINNEISMFHSILKLQYQIVFPELETLILNPIDYAKIIILIKQDLIHIKSHEEELKSIISNEKVLLLIMAGLQQVKNQFILNEEDLNKILKYCEIIIELNDILYELSEFISNKLSKFSPNVTAIVGPITASQILIATGSLRQLSLTPSCNLPALGVREMSSQSKTKSRTIRQTGYLYNSDLVKYLPEDIIKSVLRIVSAKIILAARIDLSRSSLEGEMGRKYYSEIQAKIENLLKPPENRGDKALPIPIEQKSKKRGGRRYRKMKEMFQMSELRKAQNKMEFGKEEDVVVDSFGEEIGMGMSKNSNGTGRIGSIKINSNTNAKMSKAMVNRLQQQRKPVESQLEGQFDSIILSNPAKMQAKSILPDQTTFSQKWFTGMSKRPRNDDESELTLDRKKQHI